MSLPEASVKRRTVTGFTIIVLLVAGLLSYFKLGQLEDPEFTVKTASVSTLYPGATAEEVELEVTEPIEISLQGLPEIKHIKSISRPGLSIIQIEIQPKFTSNALPQIWDKLKKKVEDARPDLPPGAGIPAVADDFGDVYGFLFAVTRDEGYTDAQLEKYADSLKKELSLVTGVAKVEFWGIQQQCIFIDIDETQISQAGISFEQIHNTLLQQNLVVDSGSVDLPTERIRIELAGAFTSIDDIGNLTISGSSVISTLDELAGVGSSSDEVFRIRDIGTVRRGYIDPPINKMRYNGEPAIGIAISNTPGVNIVDLGIAIDKRLNELKADLPIGIETYPISWQSDQVSESISGFMVSLAQAIVIVLVVLWLAMGFSAAMIVGVCGLVFVIIGSFLIMALWGIDLQRMSLGALIIAMGMMVDNAIVVADGVIVRIGEGKDRVKSAIEAAAMPSLPLLGATVIAVLAFYPIYASPESAGEYCATLFQVVAISLLLSWILSVTITPLMCIWLLPSPKEGAASDAGDTYKKGMYVPFRKILSLAIRMRWAVILVLVGCLGVSMWGFQYLDKAFFPDSARLQFMVDYWAPQGTKIQITSENIRLIEEHLLKDDRVDSVSTFVGQGPPRFYLPVEPEKPFSSYGQLIVNVKDLKGLNTLLPELDQWMKENVPEANTIARRYGLGPSSTWTVEARVSGPAIADPDTLRSVAGQVEAILKESPNAEIVRNDWRQRVKKANIDFNQERAGWANISRANVARATKRAFDGYNVGQYREDDKLLPILIRQSERDRKLIAGSLGTLQVHPSYSPNTVPLNQVTDGVELAWEDNIIWRRNRRRTITVQSRTPDGVPASALWAETHKAVEAIELPPGYKIEWGGEYESSSDAQKALLPGVLPAIVIVAITIVALFNAIRPPLIILCLVPFAMIGVVVGLLTTGQPFGFLALLGAMSLAGMMIKNAIVLLDQIDIEIAGGMSKYDAILEAACSRLRPVVLAAATTVLGLAPLLQDVFWVAMAVTIMFGLSFGTVLTMVLLPVLYATFFRVPSQK